MTIDLTESERRAQLRAECAQIEQAMRSAVRQAMLIHKRLGVPAVAWRDGKVVWILADQIVIDEPPASP